MPTGRYGVADGLADTPADADADADAPGGVKADPETLGLTDSVGLGMAGGE